MKIPLWIWIIGAIIVVWLLAQHAGREVNIAGCTIPGGGGSCPTPLPTIPTLTGLTAYRLNVSWADVQLGYTNITTDPLTEDLGAEMNVVTDGGITRTNHFKVYRYTFPAGIWDARYMVGTDIWIHKVGALVSAGRIRIFEAPTGFNKNSPATTCPSSVPTAQCVLLKDGAQTVQVRSSLVEDYGTRGVWENASICTGDCNINSVAISARSQTGHVAGDTLIIILELVQEDQAPDSAAITATLGPLATEQYVQLKTEKPDTLTYAIGGTAITDTLTNTSTTLSTVTVDLLPTLTSLCTSFPCDVNAVFTASKGAIVRFSNPTGDLPPASNTTICGTCNATVTNATCGSCTSCTPAWTNGTWGACANGNQTRIVTDSNGCGVTTNKPATTQTCSNCTPSWTVGNWSACKDSTQTRTVTDANSCSSSVGKPATTQTCKSAWAQWWTDTKNWFRKIPVVAQVAAAAVILLIGLNLWRYLRKPTIAHRRRTRR